MDLNLVGDEAKRNRMKVIKPFIFKLILSEKGFWVWLRLSIRTQHGHGDGLVLR